MGQKINQIGFRTGIMLGWKSRWYASKKEFADLLIEDHKIRKYVTEKYKFAGIPKVEIERTRDEVKVVLHAARPGVIIGRSEPSTRTIGGLPTFKCKSLALNFTHARNSLSTSRSCFRLMKLLLNASSLAMGKAFSY